MNELDEILLHQLHNTMSNKKHLNRVKRLLGDDPMIREGMKYIDGRIQFFQSMIEDKTLLKKRPKKRKKESDLLARSSTYEWYRNAFIISTIGYRMFMEYFSSYMSYFKKDKE